jgi:hypothetical protein
MTHCMDTVLGAVIHTLAAAAFSELNTVISFVFSAVEATISLGLINGMYMFLVKLFIATGCFTALCAN